MWQNKHFRRKFFGAGCVCHNKSSECVKKDGLIELYNPMMVKTSGKGRDKLQRMGDIMEEHMNMITMETHC